MRPSLRYCFRASGQVNCVATMRPAFVAQPSRSSNIGSHDQWAAAWRHPSTETTVQPKLQLKQPPHVHHYPGPWHTMTYDVCTYQSTQFELCAQTLCQKAQGCQINRDYIQGRKSSRRELGCLPEDLSWQHRCTYTTPNTHPMTGINGPEKRRQRGSSYGSSATQAHQNHPTHVVRTVATNPPYPKMSSSGPRATATSQSHSTAASSSSSSSTPPVATARLVLAPPPKVVHAPTSQPSSTRAEQPSPSSSPPSPSPSPAPHPHPPSAAVGANAARNPPSQKDKDAAAAPHLQALRARDERIASLEKELAVMEMEFARELDRASAAESETASFWQSKHWAAHSALARAQTELRLLRAEVEVREAERGELRDGWERMRREASEREDVIAELRGQVRGLKDWVSREARADGGTEGSVSDEVFAEGMAKLANGLQNWVIVHFRRAKVGRFLRNHPFLPCEHCLIVQSWRKRRRRAIHGSMPRNATHLIDDFTTLAMMSLWARCLERVFCAFSKTGRR